MPRRSSLLRPRKGSILATSISLITVFLTLIVGSMAYVQSAQDSGRNDRLRATAEEAAKSGLELVMGWAAANIDKETRLPRQWDNMADGEVIDPVKQIIQHNEPTITSLSNVTAANLGTQLGTDTGEYIVGVNGRYVTTFKARVQQYQISNDQPRQFRIGVIGRVRRMPPNNRPGLNNIDANERDSLVAERVIITTVGKEAACRYAALIDIDGVRNWVPGEITTGPVHINRGYVDDDAFLNSNLDLTQLRTNPSGAVPGFPGVKYSDVRSVMELYIDGPPGNVGFKKPAGGAAYPIFQQPVSITEFRDASDTTLGKSDDPAAGVPTVAVRANTYPYDASSPASVMTYRNQIFVAPENSGQTRYGGGYAGPIIVSEPKRLPRSIRNSLNTAIGGSGNVILSTNWDDLPNGVYVPTSAMLARASAGQPVNQGYAPGGVAQAPSGGIYVRGTIEVMRAGVANVGGVGTSWYLFQVRGDNGTNVRSYLVVADRTNRRVALHSYGNNVKISGGVIASGGTSVTSLYNNAGLGAIGSWPTTGIATDNPTTLAVEGGSAQTVFFAQPNYGQPAFNGVIYVDCSRFDPARKFDGIKTLPTTGDILALGNLGSWVGVGQPTNKGAYQVTGGQGPANAEVFATYTGTNRASAASKLNILARGNIFIQNHLLVEAPWGISGATLANVNRDNLNGITLTQTQDLLGLVSDKQIVIGLAAPQTATVGNPGTVVMATIAGLGDPAYNPNSNSVDTNYMRAPNCFIGSFTTEGLMQQYNDPATGQPAFENYWIRKPTLPQTSWAADTKSNTTRVVYSDYAGDAGYPGNPIYASEGLGTMVATADNNPNKRNPRGRLVVYGSITQKKRGIVGQGNLSFDKDFIFDKRLLTLAPPLFPATTNVSIRTESPFSPDDSDPMRKLPYRGGTTLAASDPLYFLRTQ